MKMQQPVACHFFSFNAETRTAYGKNTVIIIGEESRCFRLIAADFENIMPSVSFNHPT